MTVSEVTAVVNAVAGLGGIVLAIGSALERLKALQASNKSQGERIGALERGIQALHAREKLKTELGIVDRHVDRPGDPG